MRNPQEILSENLQSVRQRIAQAAAEVGRNAEEITLVAVTKYVSSEVASILVELGCRDLGESRPQLLELKAKALCEKFPVAKRPRWHLVGHLQRNKIAKVLPYCGLIHSGDSLRLLEALDAEAVRQQQKVPVLLQVNISGESQKQGFDPAELDTLLPIFEKLRTLDFQGLMGMAGLDISPEETRRQFALLRELRDRLVQNQMGSSSFSELSMGMSDDLELAVREGATIVRIGSALFEGLDSISSEM